MSDSAPVQSRADAVFRMLRELVIVEFQPGDQLPSENELAERYAVSRLTIREALKALSGRGLVRLRRGTRPVVLAQDSHMLMDYFDVEVRRDPRGLLELVDIRRALEELSASEAARVATPPALRAIDDTVERMAAAADAALQDPAAMSAYHEADLEFHAALALASGNRMLARVIEGLSPSLRESFRISAQGHLARGGSLTDVVDAHREIASRVAHGDAAGARRAIAAHLDEAERDLNATLSRAGADLDMQEWSTP